MKFLTPAEINTIRQMEWREKDTVVPSPQITKDNAAQYLTS